MKAAASAAWPEGVARAAWRVACWVMVWACWVRARAACWFQAVLVGVGDVGVRLASAESFSKRTWSKHGCVV